MFKMSGFKITSADFSLDSATSLIGVYTNPSKPYVFYVPVRPQESEEAARMRVQKMLNYLNGSFLMCYTFDCGQS